MPHPKATTTNLDRPGTLSRRQFGRNAVFATALALSPLTAVEESGSASVAIPQAQPEHESNLTPEQSQEVAAKLANILRKFGGRLSGEQQKRLRRILVYNQKLLASIRAFPLQNGDPPASVLKLDSSLAFPPPRNIIEGGE